MINTWKKRLERLKWHQAKTSPQEDTEKDHEARL